MTASDVAVTPLVALLVGAVVVFFQARILRGRGAAWTGAAAFAFLALSFGSAAALQSAATSGRFAVLGRVPLDASGLAYFLVVVATGLGMAVALFSIGHLRKERGVERYYPLLLLMVAGVAGIGYAADLFSLFVFFELMAIASYGLVAYDVNEAEPLEAGMKYVVMSATGSLVALLGIALVYLGTGSLDLGGIRTAIVAGQVPAAIAAPAIGLLIAGFGVKAAVVPLHTWLPDAHSAAPSGISAMLSGIVIQAGLVTLVKSVGLFAGTADISFGLLLAILAVLTMTVGNLMALKQTDLKRMLAFSSVSQVGYILLGFGLGLEYGVLTGFEGSLFHILNHAIMKGGAFLAAGAFLWYAGSRNLHRLAGVGRSMPLVGASFAVFLLGLAGIPPMSGFLSKLLIAKAGLDAGGALPLAFVVALAANSVLSLAYYVPAMNRILFAEGSFATKKVPWTMQIPIAVLASATIAIGLFPEGPLQLVASAADGLLRSIGGG